MAFGLLGSMVRAGIIAPMRPDKYLRIAAVARREGLAVTSGFGMSAQRCPNRPALIDEIGSLHQSGGNTLRRPGDPTTREDD